MKIAMIGSGNVATRLGARIANAGHSISQVYSRNAKHAQKLAQGLHCNSAQHLSQIISDADLYLIAVPDDAIATVVAQLPTLTGSIAHTSGSVSMLTLQSHHTPCGVYYPLQSLRAGTEEKHSNYPICLEASDNATMELLKKLATDCGQPYVEINSEKRQVLHLAAVFANNFTNHMATAAHQLLTDQHLSPRLLDALLMETIERAATTHPALLQTGPAVRNDQQTIDTHMQLLAQYPKLRAIYEAVTESIREKQLKN